jgi:hypothetical protein
MSRPCRPCGGSLTVAPRVNFEAIDLRLDLRNTLAQLEDWARTLDLLREATTLALRP